MPRFKKDGTPCKPPKPYKPRKRKQLKYPQYATPRENNIFTRLWADPKWREWRHAQIRANHNKGGRKPGTPDGYSFKEWMALREKAKIKAEQFMEKMKPFIPDNEEAALAITELVTLINMPLPAADKIKAASTLLTFVQRKPVQATEMQVSAAKQFLQAIEDDDEESALEVITQESDLAIEYNPINAEREGESQEAHN